MGWRGLAAACCVLGLLLVGGPPQAGAAGAIDVTNATQTIGAGTPSGTTVIDAAAPAATKPILRTGPTRRRWTAWRLPPAERRPWLR